MALSNASAISYSLIFDQQIKKNSVAKSISIYNNQGIPLTAQSNDDNINSTHLEGGFLVAITSFAQEKIQNCCVKFESDQNGTFLIIKSVNLIGALLWNDESNLPIESSEQVLDELLDYLESTKAYNNPESIPNIVEQYCTI